MNIFINDISASFVNDSRPGEVPELGRCVLPRRRLLRPRLRRHLAVVLQEPRELARRVSHPGFAQGSRELSVRRHRKQSGLGRQPNSEFFLFCHEKIFAF